MKMSGSTMSLRLLAVGLAVALLLVVALAGWSARTVAAAEVGDPTELIISEYVEGSSNNKAIELYNGTGSDINLATGEYKLQLFVNGSATGGSPINLDGTIAAGGTFVIANSGAGDALKAYSQQLSGSVTMTGDDAVVLLKGSTVVDSLGQVGFDPGTEWGTGLVSTNDNTLRRKSSVCTGDTNTGDVFDPATEWDGYALDTFTGLGSHTISCSETAPSVVSTDPTDGATDFNTNGTLSIRFSEPVTLTGTVAITCSLSSTQAVTPTTTNSVTYELAPTGLQDGDVCTVTVTAAQVEDKDTDDPPNVMEADFSFGFTAADLCALPFTSIGEIQGTTDTTPFASQQVTTMGVVISDDEGASPTLRGFYLQDPDGDADATTSDGIFVYNASNNDVSVGDMVRVTGTVSEFQGQTQIGGTVTILACGTGSVTPVDVELPFPTADYPERFEGMLVRLPQTLTVTEHYQLGRFGQVLLSSGGRLRIPTHVAAPGAAANAVAAANDLNKILVDDALNNQNPDPILFGRGGNPLSASNTLRGGDTVTDLVGVMTYTWAGNAASGNAYRVRPVNALGGTFNFEVVNERPAAAPEVGGRLTVVGMNMLNFFNTFSGCTAGAGGATTDCRGAGDQVEFDRQWPKTVAAILKMDPDVLGFNELENDGYGADSAVQFLVDKLNDATSPGTYAFIDADTATGEVNALGTDAIKVGLIYKPATVTPVGQTAALNSTEFVNGGDSAERNRPALAQAFEENGTGERFIVAVNHLKSKGSACDDPDTGDGQGNCNIVRTNAANTLVEWLATDPTETGDPDVLLVGDYNSYSQEDPISAILSAGYRNLIADKLGPDAYSYVFDGEWGYLDHALASRNLARQVTGVADYHVNADEPTALDYNTDFKSAGQIDSLYAADEFRNSDHDPVIVGLNLREVYSVYVSASGGTAVSVGAPNVAYKSFDILYYDGAVWTKWFDGAAAGLVPTKRIRHDIDAFHIEDEDSQQVMMSFAQSATQVPGIAGRVQGSDVVMWDGAAFSMVFDGEDVGLTLANENIDALHVLAEDPAGLKTCAAYLLISTKGTGSVPFNGHRLKFSGEDILGFCAARLGPTTSGTWDLVLDGSAIGMRRNALDSMSLADDGRTLYLTTRSTFSFGALTGQPSTVIAYDLPLGTYSGPYFIPRDSGLRQRTDGLAVMGLLPGID